MLAGTSRRRAIALLALGVVLFLALIAVFARYIKPTSIYGAVIREDSDPKRQSPITDVEVSVENMNVAPTKTDFSGYFKLTLPRRAVLDSTVTLRFRRADYRPLEVSEPVSSNLYVIRMTPTDADDAPELVNRSITVSNIYVRYSIQTNTSMNIGTGVKTFEVENTGNTRCDHKSSCSPDGKWKAATASVSLDAGGGNQYEDARLSCIAGPCPFTKIISDGFSKGGQRIDATVLDWSDTTTFLLQAEVFRNGISDIVRESYPVIFGESMNFTLPAAAEGPSLEAEIDGTNIIFPLRPDPTLSWANCNVRVGKDQSKTYRCQLKTGYRFR